MMPDQVRKWMRQQSKDFYAAGFDALVKWRDKRINVVGEYVEKKMFLPSFEYHLFYVLYPFVAYLLTSSRLISLLFRVYFITLSVSKPAILIQVSHGCV
jgi:hypothetical protein